MNHPRNKTQVAAIADSDSENARLAKEGHVPGMKSNIVRGTTALSQARIPGGHHNTWACPKGR